MPAWAGPPRPPFACPCPLRTRRRGRPLLRRQQRRAHGTLPAALQPRAEHLQARLVNSPGGGRRRRAPAPPCTAEPLTLLSSQPALSPGAPRRCSSPSHSAPPCAKSYFLPWLNRTLWLLLSQVPVPRQRVGKDGQPLPLARAAGAAGHRRGGGVGGAGGGGAGQAVRPALCLPFCALPCPCCLHVLVAPELPL